MKQMIASKFHLKTDFSVVHIMLHNLWLMVLITKIPT